MYMKQRIAIIGIFFIVFPGLVRAQEAITAFNGEWVINEVLSDDTDKQVEKAIRAAGGKPDSGGRKGKGRYRGGPEEHELYDRMSYDAVLTIFIDSPEVRFTYGDNFVRTFYTDGRGRSVSATGGYSEDYSFGDWGEKTLQVESRPRDGGWTREVYRLQKGENGELQLRAELKIKPLTFSVPIELLRIYTRPQ